MNRYLAATLSVFLIASAQAQVDLPFEVGPGVFAGWPHAGY